MSQQALVQERGKTARRDEAREGGKGAEVSEAEVTVDKVTKDGGTGRQAGDDAAGDDEAKDAGKTDHADNEFARAKDETQEEDLEVSDGA